MNLKSFISEALTEAILAVEETSKSLDREMFIETEGEYRGIEFDTAVTAESSQEGSRGTGIQVLSFFNAMGELTNADKKVEANRIKLKVVVPAKRQSVIEAERAITIKQINSYR